jgi:catechol 2,3-dioxygenase-like lactoylglutathione lyase family enzyme
MISRCPCLSVGCAVYSSAFLLEREGRLAEAAAAWRRIVDSATERGWDLTAAWPRQELQRVLGLLESRNDPGGWPPGRSGIEKRWSPGAISLTAMDITIHASFLPHNDPDASLAFYRDALGFEVRNDVGYGGMRWITVGPVGQPGTSIVLEPPAAPGCGITDDERRTIAEMMAKGSYAGILLATTDLNGLFDRLQASDAEVVQEPAEQPYGVRDCAFRDPAGNLVRIQEIR